MIETTEQEIIIKDAIEFLKRNNLIADINEKIILLDFCLNAYYGIYKIKLDDEKDCLLVYKEPRRYPIEISSDNKELYNSLNEKYNEIIQKWAEMKENEIEQQEQAEQLIENYSDNDEHRDEEMLKACQQRLDLVDEMVEQGKTNQDAWINIQNSSKYRRKSDGKIFFLISQHELKTTMNGITPSKEICEIVVDIVKLYVLFSPAPEGRYNHDILYVKENELNKDYERLSED